MEVWLVTGREQTNEAADGATWARLCGYLVCWVVGRNPLGTLPGGSGQAGQGLVTAVIAAMVLVAVVMVIAVVFMVPVAFVHLPALLVVVVVGVAPIGSLVGWPLPAARNPDVAATVGSPVAVDPLKAFAGRDGAYLVADRGRG